MLIGAQFIQFTKLLKSISTLNTSCLLQEFLQDWRVLFALCISHILLDMFSTGHSRKSLELICKNMLNQTLENMKLSQNFSQGLWNQELDKLMNQIIWVQCVLHVTGECFLVAKSTLSIALLIVSKVDPID